MTSFDAVRKEFSEIFSANNFYQAIVFNAQRCLRTYPVRSIYWKVFLGALSRTSTDTWLEETKKFRDEYNGLRKKYTVVPDTGGSLDLKINNPLSTSKESPWNQFYQDTQLCEMIKLDLKRTHPSNEWFQSETVQTMMLNILFIWSKLNPTVSYRQGMNELLSVLIFTVNRDGREKEGGEEDDLLASMIDIKYIEHDSFILFRSLMLAMGQYFRKAPEGISSAESEKKDESKDVLGKQAAVINLANQSSPSLSPTLPGDNNSGGGSGGDTIQEGPTAMKCSYIHHTLLKQVDLQLYNHLVKMDLQPQVYLLRWVRLLFSREFHIEDVTVLWDSIFAQIIHLPLTPKTFRVADYIAISMLIYVKKQLLTGDSMFCLKRLMKYPPVEEMKVIIHLALYLDHPNNPVLEQEGFDPPILTAMEEEEQQPMYKTTKLVPLASGDDPLSNIISSGASPAKKRTSKKTAGKKLLSDALTVGKTLVTKAVGAVQTARSPSATKQPRVSNPRNVGGPGTSSRSNTQPSSRESKSPRSGTTSPTGNGNDQWFVVPSGGGIPQNSTKSNSNHIRVVENSGTNGTNSQKGPTISIQSITAMQKEIEDKKFILNEMGLTVENVMNKLFAELQDKNNEKRDFNEEVLLGSIAELKRVKDVLLGRIEVPDVVSVYSSTYEDTNHGDGPPAQEKMEDSPPTSPKLSADIASVGFGLDDPGMEISQSDKPAPSAIPGLEEAPILAADSIFAPNTTSNTNLLWAPATTSKPTNTVPVPVTSSTTTSSSISNDTHSRASLFKEDSSVLSSPNPKNHETVKTMLNSILDDSENDDILIVKKPVTTTIAKPSTTSTTTAPAQKRNSLPRVIVSSSSSPSTSLIITPSSIPSSTTPATTITAPPRPLPKTERPSIPATTSSNPSTKPKGSQALEALLGPSKSKGGQISLFGSDDAPNRKQSTDMFDELFSGSPDNSGSLSKRTRQDSLF